MELTISIFTFRSFFPPLSPILHISLAVACIYCSYSCVVYGCETWSLTVREEHRLGVFENRVLIKIFGLKRDEATG